MRTAVFLCARAHWRLSRLALRCALPVILPVLERRYVRLHGRSIISLDRVGLAVEQRDAVRQQTVEGRTVVLAVIGRYSLFVPRFKELNIAAHLSNVHVARKHKQVELVALPGGAIGVRKQYRSRWRFFCELRALQALHGRGCRVPDILDVDFKAPAVVTAYIPGPTANDFLAPICSAARADYDRGTPKHMLPRRGDWGVRLAAMRKAAAVALPASLGAQVAEQIRLLHGARIIWGNITYLNIVVEEGTGLPWLVDFDYSGYFPRLMEPLFAALSDREAADCSWHFPATAQSLSQEQLTRD